ncbi:S1C family serine protease [Thermogutta sp.]|uniref:S1C family serine protease n=1 Tax=Thermogutta sp. TaxID=1962930 RepID=UPI0032203B62
MIRKNIVWNFIGFAVALTVVVCQARAQETGRVRTITVAVDRYGPVDQQIRAELQQQLADTVKILQAQANATRLIAKLIGPAVVHIEAEVLGRRALQHGAARPVEEAGSGIIVKLAGKTCVFTNRHVVAGASPDNVRISLADGRIIQPSKIWSDPETDVAVMEVSVEDVVAAPLGNSDEVEIGDFVLAFGSPFGLSHSVTFGIISGKGRRDLDLGDSNVRLQDFLQTDAAINPGNSGGPLVNLNGEVIGINTAIASSSGGNEGVGFAIPINTFLFTAKQLVEKGAVTRAFLGVTLDARFDYQAAQQAGLQQLVGTRVVTVTPDSPAAKAGLRPGDIILRMDGKLIENDAHLITLVNMSEVGKEVTLQVLRDGHILDVKAVLVARPQSPTQG